MLDNTGVHPESYDARQGAARSCWARRRKRRARTCPQAQAYGAERPPWRSASAPTLRDIVQKSFQSPGEYARRTAPRPSCTDVLDIMTGMKPGTVRNVIDFGVFVDIGVHQTVRPIISVTSAYQASDEVVAVGDVVKVVVLDVDEKEARISLSMK